MDFVISPVKIVIVLCSSYVGHILCLCSTASGGFEQQLNDSSLYIDLCPVGTYPEGDT